MLIVSVIVLLSDHITYECILVKSYAIFRRQADLVESYIA